MTISWIYCYNKCKNNYNKKIFCTKMGVIIFYNYFNIYYGTALISFLIVFNRDEFQAGYKIDLLLSS